jgi:hypothetical protein
MKNKPSQKIDFDRDWEIELIGDVQKFCSLVKEVADELDITDYLIEAKLVNPNEANFAYFNIYSVFGSHPSPLGGHPSYTLIGVLTLKSIGAERTILRIPPRSQWDRRISEARELLRMGLVGENQRALFDSLFARYIECLQTKLKSYGLKLTWYKRIWRQFEKLIGIYKMVKH